MHQIRGHVLNPTGSQPFIILSEFLLGFLTIFKRCTISSQPIDQINFKCVHYDLEILLIKSYQKLLSHTHTDLFFVDLYLLTFMVSRHAQTIQGLPDKMTWQICCYTQEIPSKLVQAAPDGRRNAWQRQSEPPANTINVYACARARPMLLAPLIKLKMLLVLSTLI